MCVEKKAEEKTEERGSNGWQNCTLLSLLFETVLPEVFEVSYL